MIESFLFIAGDEGLTTKQLVALTEQGEASVKQGLKACYYLMRSEKRVALR